MSEYKIIRLKKDNPTQSIVDDIGAYVTYINDIERTLDTMAIACRELNKEWPEREYVIALVIEKE